MKKLMLGCGGLFALVVLALVAVAVLAAVGSRQQPQQTVTRAATPAGAVAAAATPAPSSAPAHVGDRVESAGVALTVNGVKRADSLSQVQRAKPGRTYLVADVTVENTGRDKAPYNPLYFKVKDANGYEYTGIPSGTDQSLKSGELQPGDKARGTVAFDVPSDAAGLVMSYQPIVILGGYQPIRVSLE